MILMIKIKQTPTLILLMLFLTASSSGYSASINKPNTDISNINWEKIEEKTVTLFYPGQSSWEWLLTRHSAAKSVRKGAPCLECHEDEEKEMGNIIVRGEKLEPFPIKDKPGFIKVKIKSTYDDYNIYFQVQWKDLGFKSGPTSQFKNKVTLMIGDNSVKEFPVAGCWGVCHDDATNMNSHKEKNERQLYTSASRVKIKKSGGGDNFIDDNHLTSLLEEKNILEYWQLRLTNNGQSSTSHGYILEKRHKINNKQFDASVTHKNNIWTAIFSRKRNINSKGIIPLNRNHEYTLGIALHDDYVSGRNHYVGFGRTFSLGELSGSNGNSEITVQKQ